MELIIAWIKKARLLVRDEAPRISVKCSWTTLQEIIENSKFDRIINEPIIARNNLSCGKLTVSSKIDPYSHHNSLLITSS